MLEMKNAIIATAELTTANHGVLDAGPTIDAMPEAPEPPPVDRAILLRDDLVARFDAAEDGPALYALIDDATVGKQRAWLKEKRPELFNDVEAAARGAVARTETQSRVDAGDTP